MLLEQTLEKLNAMKLFGMAKALRDWTEKARAKDISPADKIGRAHV